MIRLLSTIAPPDVAVAETRQDLSEALHPAEEDYIARAVDKRRAEFTTVRHCAGQALSVLGRERPVQVPGPRGEPTWPSGVVGSMTHCRGYRAAAVALETAFDAIGIDAEPNEPLPGGILNTIASDVEQEHLRAAAAPGRGDDPVALDRLLFSAKESVYKAWYPKELSWLGFHDVIVTIEGDGRFTAEVTVTGPGGGRRLEGRWRAAGGTLVTAVVVPAGAWRMGCGANP